MAGAQAALQAAVAQLTAAQAKLDQTLNPSPADLAAAQAAVDQARSNQQSTEAKLHDLVNPRPEDVAKEG